VAGLAGFVGVTKKYSVFLTCSVRTLRQLTYSTYVNHYIMPNEK